MNQHDAYPDISDILARKAQGRKDIAARSFGQKIAMVEAMRERLAPFKRAREAKVAEKASRARLSVRCGGEAGKLAARVQGPECPGAAALTQDDKAKLRDVVKEAAPAPAAKPAAGN